MPYRKIYLLLFILCTTCTMYAQLPTGPEIAWQRCYGGSLQDWFVDAIKTSKNQIMACIYALSEDGDFTGITPPGGLVMVFDESFNIVWDKAYIMQDCPFSPQKIIEIENGSFVFAGYPGMFCEGHHGFSDLALMKTDSVGNLIWQKLYGSPGSESFNSFMHT